MSAAKRRMRTRRLVLLVAVAAVAGAAVLADGWDGGVASAAPFDPFRFFDGEAASRGTVATLFVWRQPFTARFEGRVRDGELVLDERFRFPDGAPLQRWRLRRGAGTRIVGTVETEGASGQLHAPVPVEGTADGTSLTLRYRGYAPGGDALLGFRHRMVGQADGTVLNRVRITTFGVPIAGARVVFERAAAPATAEQK